MADTLSDSQRSRCMAAIRGVDTVPEMIVRRMAHGLGYRFRLHVSSLPGKPDIVFASRQAVIFVNGCFWHMHNCKRGKSTPATNAAFWEEKRSRTRQRDRRNSAALRKLGWRVLVVWECQTKDPVHLAEKLVGFLGQ